MKIQNLKTKVIGPVLLLIPMACMHLSDDHHSGYGSCYHYSEPSQQSIQSSIPGMETGGIMEQGKMTTSKVGADVGDPSLSG